MLRSDGRIEPAARSKLTGIRIRRGDRLRLETPGGGGYGDPRERPEAAIARDLAMGSLTLEGAERAYGTRVREISPRFGSRAGTDAGVGR